MDRQKGGERFKYQLAVGWRLGMFQRDGRGARGKATNGWGRAQESSGGMEIKGKANDRLKEAKGRS